MLCYNDYYFKQPNKWIIWMLYIRMYCIFGFNSVNHIQTERTFEHDLKTIKCIKYYIFLNCPLEDHCLLNGFSLEHRI